MVKGSHGPFCLGDLIKKRTCDRSKKGTAVAIGSACKTCKEQRCKAHCRCARENKLKGHSLPRGVRRKLNTPSTQSTASTTSHATSLAVANPVGRASTPSTVLFANTVSLIQSMGPELEKATEVELATFQYDNARLHKRLLDRLRGRTAFALNVYIDREQLAGRVPKMQKSMLRELRAAQKHNPGAKVHVCKGPGRLGAYHCKCLIIDRRYAYTGSMNFTDKSEANEEFPERKTGPIVAQYLERLAAHRAGATLWDGS